MSKIEQDEFHDSEACPNCRLCPDCGGINEREECRAHDAFDCGAVDEANPPPVTAILYSHGARTGYLEGGALDGKTFLRNWDSNSIATDAGLYRINRKRVERHGNEYCVVFEFVG